MNQPDTNQLFDDKGRLLMEAFTPDAQRVLKSMRTWLASKNRRMFLPLDLLIVLVELGQAPLSRVVAEGTEGAVLPADVLPRLRALADEIEEEPADQPPTFERTFFSRGFTRILGEAISLARARGDSRVHMRDLERCILWRAEAVESASVRWAIRRLGEGGGDRIFDEKGLLRQNIFHSTTWDVLQGSMMLAASHGTPFLGTPHLVAMLCTVKNSTVWRSAKARGFDPRRLREELLRLIGNRADSIPEFLLGRKTLTPRMVRMLSFSAHRASYDDISEQHIIEGFLDDGGSSLELVQALGLESEIRRALGEPKVLEEVAPIEAAVQLNSKARPTPTLDMLGRDLTVQALEGKLPEIVGREKELQRVVNVLLRREQRNPLLTGEAGVGKTALAIALAQRIASGRVPKQLRGHRVVEINGANLMSGTSYRGDLESRIKGLLEEASEDVILFIDEAHAVFAPRAGSHAPAEIPNHFKSALASGDIAVVAATTEAEYRRWIEQDPALKRRFERVEVGEPEASLVRHILGSLVEDLEREYEVRVEEDAIETTIELSVRFIPEQRLPDKAKKLLMDACIARANVYSYGAPDDAPDTEGDGELVVTRQDVARQVHMKTGVPMERLLRGDINWWVGIEERLGQHVVGQSDAISKVARALVTGRLRSSSSRRPMASLLFVGPSGVGKGTLADAIAHEVFGSSRALLRLDMTDYQEAHSLSRLIGSPPGYVGYEDEDVLVTPLRRRPSSVVLLEDFDRAHHRIQERMLRLLREGEIADTRGHSADVRNSIFVLTIHQEARSAARIGFGDVDGDASLGGAERDLVRKMSAQVDAVVDFRALAGDSDSPALDLLSRRVDEFLDGMASEFKMEVLIDASLTEALERRVSSARDASQVELAVDDLLREPVTSAMLNGECSPSQPPILSWDGARVCVRPAPPSVQNLSEASEEE
jgi:ATP-dependent Clp protease ATP-binding subunit ClpC